jgi:hypothetical protein
MNKKKKIFVSISMDPVIFQKLDGISTDKSRLIEWLIINHLQEIGKDVSDIYL